jgi:hypothetical protein
MALSATTSHHRRAADGRRGGRSTGSGHHPRPSMREAGGSPPRVRNSLATVPAASRGKAPSFFCSAEGVTILRGGSGGVLVGDWLPNLGVRFWEQTSPPSDASASCLLFVCREGGLSSERATPVRNASGVVAGKGKPAVAHGVDVHRPPLAGSWRGPCPPWRKFPPAVLGHFLATASRSPGRRKAVDPLVVRLLLCQVKPASMQARLTHHGGGPERELSWASLGPVMWFF